jgi:hypothetical protein
MRRYESICDKAGIFPDEEVDVNVEQSGEVGFNITREVVSAEEATDDGE